ncbi:unnamed protein product [Prorocentrum cordatum]|uniref:Uncharacterized protein n=1 Tax=Prorocentrum cordatum TaxID=2364126 RepID=A0ABN9VQ70_9DINO|nr:unnamed protein product [Polarella glacialis]
MAPADLAAMQAAWLLGRKLRRWCMGIFWGARLLRTEGSCRGGARSGLWQRVDRDSPRPSQGRPPGCPEVCPGGAARPSRRQARCWGRRERRWPPPRHPRGRAGGRRAPGGEGRRGPWPSLTAGTSVSIRVTVKRSQDEDDIDIDDNYVKSECRRAPWGPPKRLVFAAARLSQAACAASRQ